MASENSQHKLDRVRRPRVQITYDVQTNGAMQKAELPFVVGVMADLSGKTIDTKPLKDRKFVRIDRYNIDEVFANANPSLAFAVKDTITKAPDQERQVLLEFEKLENFDPGWVAEKVLPKLLEARGKLVQLLGKLEGNEDLDDELSALLETDKKPVPDKAKLKALRDALTAPTTPGANGASAGAAPTAAGAAPATDGAAPATAGAAPADGAQPQAASTNSPKPGEATNPEVKP
jgi:type VI secretion system protein ImpB